ncbi:MAG: class II aldolase/adducin family protein [Melioribacteraceae bacterium]|nr:class II aldolase/adducin family protein [Melioribacteraceae bacterium]
MSLNKLKSDIIEIGKLLHQKNFVASNDGNLSIRYNDKILITPTCTSKGFLTFDDIVEIDLEGNILKGIKEPTSEMLMHLTIYNFRNDINAICHAHPIYSTAYAITGKSLSKKVLPEVIISLHEIPLVKYSTPGTKELSKKLIPYVKKYDALLLENHGALTLGKDLWEAYYKMETVEHFAKILFVAKQLGKVKELNSKEVKKLIAQREKFGVRKDIGKN